MIPHDQIKEASRISSCHPHPYQHDPCEGPHSGESAQSACADHRQNQRQTRCHIGHRAILALGIHESKLAPLVLDLVLEFLDRSVLLLAALLGAALGWVLSSTLLVVSSTSLLDRRLFGVRANYGPSQKDGASHNHLIIMREMCAPHDTSLGVHCGQWWH